MFAKVALLAQQDNAEYAKSSARAPRVCAQGADKGKPHRPSALFRTCTVLSDQKPHSGAMKPLALLGTALCAVLLVKFSNASKQLKIPLVYVGHNNTYLGKVACAGTSQLRRSHAVRRRGNLGHTTAIIQSTLRHGLVKPVGAIEQMC
ncbi:hypothetical protein MRX96_001397 [Rhipicephalus microplus]